MGPGGRRLVTSAITAVVGLLAVAPAAQASFHLMKIREVYPAGTASYVELQMDNAGEYAVAGHNLLACNVDCSVQDNFSLPNSVNPLSLNNATILIGDTGYAAAFPSGPALDELDSDANFNLSAAGGAVCWTDGTPPDCVSWGNFTGPLPSVPAGLTAGNAASPTGVSANKALRRTIAPGCPTLLEAGDDSNDSATDFSEVAPTPRDNASPITETACMLATTTIDTKPASSTNSTSASFTYHATPSTGATFECKLDAGAFTPCDPSGISYPGPLSEASHTFQVHAINGSGTGLAASYTWKVDLTAPTIGIVNHPPDPSSPNVSFTFNQSESASSYQCDLIKSGSSDPGFSPCLSTGMSYPNLADGTYTFKVRATDTAGNQSVPVASDGACTTTTTSGGTCTWTVDHLAADTMPPNTFIDTKPPDPSDSSSVSFTYHADEAATFECKLDAGPFTVCDSAGITYTGLQNGSHTFQVRATDPSNNTDASPAGYTFTVALPTGTPPPPPDPTNPPPLLPPQTIISLKSPAKTHDRTPTFRFRSSEAGSTFRCKLDNGAFKACRSPFTTKTLTFGRHTLKIQAVSGGVVDPTPATFGFKVVRH